jgi:hypothetical protein
LVAQVAIIIDILLRFVGIAQVRAVSTISSHYRLNGGAEMSFSLLLEPSPSLEITGLFPNRYSHLIILLFKFVARRYATR